MIPSHHPVGENFVQPSPPQTVSWNLTRLCNLACAHCYLDATARRGDMIAELNTNECFRVVDQIRAVSPEAMVILTGGEPLMRRDILDVCRYASQAGLWVVLGTNGTLLDWAMAKGLHQAGVKGVGISIDSLNQAAHNRFRGRPGAWKKSVEAFGLAREAGLDTVIQVSLTPWNLVEVPAMVEWACAKGARAINFYFLVCTGRGQQQTGLSPEECEQVYLQLHGLQRQYRGRVLVNAKCAPQFQRVVHQQDPGSPHLHTHQGGCPAATYYCRIDQQGEVTPCPYIPISGGNLQENSLEDIWKNAPIFSRLRNRDLLGGRCGACAYRSLCSGCRARALADLGDPLAEDPSCSYRPPPGGEEAIALPGEAAYGAASDEEFQVNWEPEALATLERIPPMIRGMVRRRLESHALTEGIGTITKELMTDLRDKRMAMLAKMGIDPPFMAR